MKESCGNLIGQGCAIITFSLVDNITPWDDPPRALVQRKPIYKNPISWISFWGDPQGSQIYGLP